MLLKTLKTRVSDSEFRKQSDTLLMNCNYLCRNGNCVGDNTINYYFLSTVQVAISFQCRVLKQQCDYLKQTQTALRLSLCTCLLCPSVPSASVCPLHLSVRAAPACFQQAVFSKLSMASQCLNFDQPNGFQSVLKRLRSCLCINLTQFSEMMFI